MSAILQTRSLGVRYGAIEALRAVSLVLEAGRVTCLMGDNGAGKSTLIRALSGVIRPTSGELLLDGQPVRFRDPRAARAAGIMTVYQDLALVPLLSVWRNFVLGAEPVRAGLLDRNAAREQARARLAELDIRVDVDRPVARLSGGERQAVAIARAVHAGARVLILDEPTAALGVAQAHRVLGMIRAVRDQGVAVLLVTHNPAHALACADRIAILQRGQVIREDSADALSAQQLATLIAG